MERLSIVNDSRLSLIEDGDFKELQIICSGIIPHLISNRITWSHIKLIFSKNSDFLENEIFYKYYESQKKKFISQYDDIYPLDRPKVDFLIHHIAFEKSELEKFRKVEPKLWKDFQELYKDYIDMPNVDRLSDIAKAYIHYCEKKMKKGKDLILHIASLEPAERAKYLSETIESFIQSGLSPLDENPVANNLNEAFIIASERAADLFQCDIQTIENGYDKHKEFVPIYIWESYFNNHTNIERDRLISENSAKLLFEVEKSKIGAEVEKYNRAGIPISELVNEFIEKYSWMETIKLSPDNVNNYIALCYRDYLKPYLDELSLNTSEFELSCFDYNNREPYPSKVLQAVFDLLENEEIISGEKSDFVAMFSKNGKPKNPIHWLLVANKTKKKRGNKSALLTFLEIMFGGLPIDVMRVAPMLFIDNKGQFLESKDKIKDRTLKDFKTESQLKDILKNCRPN
jgi:hypothetical protein